MPRAAAAATFYHCTLITAAANMVASPYRDFGQSKDWIFIISTSSG